MVVVLRGIWWKTLVCSGSSWPIPSLSNQHKHCPPSPPTPITPLSSPLEPHTKSMPSFVTWPQVYCRWVTISWKFHIDIFWITFNHIWPPAFLFNPFILIFWHIFYDSSDYLSTAWQVLPLSSLWFDMTLWPSFNAPYLGSFWSARHVYHTLFLDTP